MFFRHAGPRTGEHAGKKPGAGGKSFARLRKGKAAEKKAGHRVFAPRSGRLFLPRAFAPSLRNRKKHVFRIAPTS